MSDILRALKFKPLLAGSVACQGGEVLLFLHDVWRGYDEIITASVEGSDFYCSGKKVPRQFVSGWLELPIKIDYGSSDSILP